MGIAVFYEEVINVGFELRAIHPSSAHFSVERLNVSGLSRIDDNLQRICVSID
jgi:hypothetical protein